MKKFIVTFTAGIGSMYAHAKSRDELYCMIEKTTHPAIGFAIQEIPKQSQPQQQEHQQPQ
jgi:hypothetical protein